MSSRRVGIRHAVSALAAVAALAAMAGSAAPGMAETAAKDDSKPAAASTPASGEKAGGDKKFTKPQIEAFLTKCSTEADEKGLTKAKNKLAERKAFRRQCMSKFGVEPK